MNHQVSFCPNPQWSSYYLINFSDAELLHTSWSSSLHMRERLVTGMTIVWDHHPLNLWYLQLAKNYWKFSYLISMAINFCFHVNFCNYWFEHDVEINSWWFSFSFRGRLAHGRHFTFKSIITDSAITLVSSEVTGTSVDDNCPYAACGTWLQVFKNFWMHYRQWTTRRIQVYDKRRAKTEIKGISS